MPRTTIQDLQRRVDELEHQMARLHQRLGISPAPEVPAAGVPDLDTALDQFFATAGIRGELCGLAQLRALQAEQERLWVKRRRKPKPSLTSTGSSGFSPAPSVELRQSEEHRRC